MTEMRNYVDPPVVHWYYGKTGTGKTRYAFDTFKNIHSCRRVSFREVVKYENVIIDNYDARRHAERSLRYLLDVLNWMATDNKITKNIVIASLKSPEEMYGGKCEVLKYISVKRHFAIHENEYVYSERFYKSNIMKKKLEDIIYTNNILDTELIHEIIPREDDASKKIFVEDAAFRNRVEELCSPREIENNLKELIVKIHNNNVVELPPGAPIPGEN